MIRPSCMTICGAALLAVVATAPALASTNALSFVDRLVMGAHTRVIDVRTQERCEKASLPGARCLPAAALFHKDGRPVDYHTLRWLLGTIGLSGKESVLVVGADAGNAAAVGALLYLAGQRAVAVLDKPLTVLAKAEAGSARGMTREAVFTAPMRDLLLVAAPDQARGAIASGPPRQRLTRFARMTADGTSTRLRLTP
ncbi:MAG: rhodanese-like domain-containing protein [Pseudolabrys sp.]